MFRSDLLAVSSVLMSTDQVPEASHCMFFALNHELFWWLFFVLSPGVDVFLVIRGPCLFTVLKVGSDVRFVECAERPFVEAIEAMLD
jgi:hypothetical protein